MDRVVQRIKPVIDELSDYKENKRARRTLTEVLDKIKNALVLNPEYCPEGLIPLADGSSDTTGKPGYISQARGGASTKEKEQSLEIVQKKKRKRKPIVKRLTPTAVVKRLKLGQQGVSCCIDHFGPDGPECLTESTVIYINRDHPLYKKEAQKANTYELHVARLLTQEICLMKDPRNPRQAFQRQSKLLRDALVEIEKNNLNSK